MIDLDALERLAREANEGRRVGEYQSATAPSTVLALIEKVRAYPAYLTERHALVAERDDALAEVQRLQETLDALGNVLGPDGRLKVSGQWRDSDD